MRRTVFAESESVQMAGARGKWRAAGQSHQTGRGHLQEEFHRRKVWRAGEGELSVPGGCVREGELWLSVPGRERVQGGRQWLQGGIVEGERAGRVEPWGATAVR